MYYLTHVGMSWVVWKADRALRAFPRRADALAFLQRVERAEKAGENACAFT
jgi:hypothetical protein